MMNTFTNIFFRVTYTAAVFLYLSLSANCQPLIEEHDFLEKCPAIADMHKDVIIENVVTQFSLMKIPESDRPIPQPDINAGNSCKEGTGRESNDKINECISTVFGKISFVLSCLKKFFDKLPIDLKRHCYFWRNFM